MKTMPWLIASLVIAGLMTAFAFWAADQLPAGATLPTHWNAAGEVDDTSPALQALLMPAGVVVLIGLVFSAIPAIEPLQQKLSASAPVLKASWAGTLALMVALQGFIAAPVFGMTPGSGFVLAMVGVLLIVIGNVLPKSRPGFFVGIRTPWTIIDADNWIATHRLGGKLFMLAGAAILLASLLPVPPLARTVIVFAATVGAALVPTVYSWWLWQSGKVERG